MGNKDSGAPDTKGGYWGIAFADHDKEEIILTKKYYCFGQFSKFIRPGDTIIHTGKNTLGAISKDKSKLTLVAFNKNSKEKEITFDVGDFKNSGIIEVTRTSGNMSEGENWARLEDISFNSPIINLKLKEHSVTTFVIK